MWVFTRPRGGQDYYLLMCEIRGGVEICPIHRLDGKDQIPKFCGFPSQGHCQRKGVSGILPEGSDRRRQLALSNAFLFYSNCAGDVLNVDVTRVFRNDVLHLLSNSGSAFRRHETSKLIEVAFEFQPLMGRAANLPDFR